MQDSRGATRTQSSVLHALARTMLVAMMIVIATVITAVSNLGAQEAFAAQGLEAGSVAPGTQQALDAQSTSLAAQSSEYIYRDPADSSNYIYISNKESGSAKFDPETRTLTLSNVKCPSGDLSVYLTGKPVTVNLVGTNSVSAIYSDVSLIVKGSGSLAGRITCSSSKSARVRIAGGTIKGNVSSGGAFTMTGGKVVGNVSAFNGSAKMTGGAIKGALSIDGKLTMKGGTISLTNVEDAAVRCSSLAMTGGSIVAKNCSNGVSVHGKSGTAHNLVISGGRIEVVSPNYTGIMVSGGNLLQKGGKLAVVGAQRSGISVTRLTHNGKAYGGKATIKGGIFKATVKTPSTYWALDATVISNKIASVKALTGRVAKGMQFKRGGNVYKTMDSYSAKLVKYGSSKTKAVINKVTYGKNSLEVQGIAALAFNTTAGKKVTSIVVDSFLEEIGSKAFANTKSLKALRFNYTSWMKRNYDSSYNLRSVTVYPGDIVSAKAFYKCGKGGGKYLKVSLGKNGVWHKDASVYKRFLISRGLSRSAKLKTY